MYIGKNQNREYVGYKPRVVYLDDDYISTDYEDISAIH